ncbi:MAG: hypothetical protein IPH36_12010 [Saprospiraceae bacterium]|nr:hypothetical protein [Saprospiraceae bacterium]
MASTADIRNGLCMSFNNDIYTVVEFQHVKPGKGAAFVRTKLKSLTVVLEVTYAEPGVRGDTATNVTKSATLETGAEIKVPIFINQGDKIKIDTRTGDYLERMK